jgi:hypothetical protein
MKIQKTKYLILFPIIIALILTAFGGGISGTNAAGGHCYQTFLPMVISSGGSAHPGPTAPGTMSNCSVGGELFADFNGDGYADLAIGSPEETVLFNGVDVEGAGAVNVIYGTASGLSSANNQIWHRGMDEIYRDPETDDNFGHTLAVGDFDDDGYDDLAIGVPNSTAWLPVDNAGVVQVLYGSAIGLTADRDEVWAQSIIGIPGDVEADDHFGHALTTGDFNFDGYSDLAIGVIGETVNGVPSAGGVNIIYGDNNGLSNSNSHLITQSLGGSADPPETDDYFGYALTTGDFDNDGIDDLAVGIPDEDIPTIEGNLADAGAIQIFYGAGYGLVDTITNSAESDFWYAGSNAYVEGALEAGDRFGHSVEAADFDGDGYDDLAVGIPSETHGSGGSAIIFAGAINVFYGSSNGIDANLFQPAPIWHQDSSGILDEPEFAERYGYSLAAGDFNNDGYADLAIGVPWEVNNIGNNIGAVGILYGSVVGLTSLDNDLLFLGPLQTDQNDQFGYTLSVGNFDGDSFFDLAIGVPNDTPDAVLNTGSVVVRYSDSDGVPESYGQQTWHQGSPGILGSPETDERFGAGLP